MIADLVVTKPQARRRRLLMLVEAARNLGRSKSWLRVETASGRIGCVREGRESAAFGRGGVGPPDSDIAEAK